LQTGDLVFVYKNNGSGIETAADLNFLC